MSPFFIYPDSELYVQLIRVLSIVEKISLNRNNSPVLNIEKISVFDFLLRHPNILFKILKVSDKQINFSLDDVERNSISSSYPSSEGLYNFDDHRKLTQILLIYDFIKIVINETQEPYYCISEKGKTFIEQIDSPYVLRQREVANAFIPLQSQTYRNLLAQIIPHINGK